MLPNLMHATRTSENNDQLQKTLLTKPLIGQLSAIRDHLRKWRKIFQWTLQKKKLK